MGRAEDLQTIAGMILDRHRDDPEGFVDDQIRTARAGGDVAMAQRWEAVKPVVVERLRDGT